MTIHAYQSEHSPHFFEIEIDLEQQVVDYVLRYRNAHEQKPEKLSWADLSQEEQDFLRPKIRKAIRENNRS